MSSCASTAPDIGGEPYTVSVREFARRLGCDPHTVRAKYREFAKRGPRGAWLFRESDVSQICMASARVVHGEYAYEYTTAEVARVLRSNRKNLHRFIGEGESFGRARRYSRKMVLAALAKRGSLDAHGIAFLLRCNPWQAWVVENMLIALHRNARSIARDGTYVWPVALMREAGIGPFDKAKFLDLMRDRVTSYRAAASKEPRGYRSSTERRVAMKKPLWRVSGADLVAVGQNESAGSGVKP